METNIIVMLYPSVMAQKIYVYQNGECVQTINFYLDDIYKMIDSLTLCYNVNRISLCGNRLFANEYMEQLKTKFANNFMDIEIDIVEK